jgi:hypothetical protein
VSDLDQKKRLAEIASRFDQALARLDDALATKQPPPAATSAKPSIFARLRRSPQASQWDAVTQRLSELDTFQTKLLRRAHHENANADEWERRAMLCLKAGDDDLARESLRRQREHLDNATHFEALATQVNDELRELRRAVDEISAARPGHQG